MRAWWLVLMVGACGQGEDPADYTPEPIDWTDFTNQSTKQTITGINRDIEINLQASFGSGTPTIEYRLDTGEYSEFSPTAPTSALVAPGTTMQFRVRGSLNGSAFITATNASTGDSLLDTVQGTVTTLVTGAGTVASPFVAPGATPTSCAAFLAAYPEQAAQDGIYRIDPSKPLDAYCDMTTDEGGWTLVARVIATSTMHATAAPIGNLSDPLQTTTAKYEDATINTLGFATARLSLEATGHIYARVSMLDLSGAAFNLPSTAAPALNGPYNYTFLTMTTCGSDCGVAVVGENMGFGRMCGYQYYASAGNPRAGMGCQGAPGKYGTVWVK